MRVTDKKTVRRNKAITTDRARPYVRKWIVVCLGIASLASGANLAAQTTPETAPTDVLHQLNNSVEALVRRISPSVVQIVVTGYRSAEDANRGQTDVMVGRERAIGSGVIVDPEGYIVTNAHVLNGAQQIEVVVPALATSAPSAADVRGKSYQARIVGTSREIDLAVLKIEADGLPAVPILASNAPRQGEMVFAFGSPQGLSNTVTMGVVSSVARQPDPDSPLVYVQTDTPINPGNSGGPLVDADGKLVGINTFILSTTGGNQGLGFAIPAAEVAYAYPQLLKYGHTHEPEIGALIQSITPELAAALHLPRDFGVIVSDVAPGGPADAAGLKVQDIIVSVDGVPTDSLPLLAERLYTHSSGEHAKFEVLRGSDRLQLEVLMVPQLHQEDSLVDSADPAKDLVRSLGILAIELTPDIARTLPNLRIPSGVIVAARTLGVTTGDVPLQAGDVIHEVNGTAITSVAELRAALAKLKPGDPVGLRIERYSQLQYVSFQL